MSYLGGQQDHAGIPKASNNVILDDPASVIGEETKGNAYGLDSENVTKAEVTETAGFQTLPEGSFSQDNTKSIEGKIIHTY